MRKVALYGNSLLLAGIGARLERRPDLQLISVDAALPSAAHRMSALCPDVVVFDLAAAQPDTLALWKAQPHLLLIGVDLAADQALVLSSQTSRMFTTEDLDEVIERSTS